MSGREARGFTLIEVLLAIAVMALLTVMLYGSFDQTGRIAEHVDQVADQYRVARQVFARLSDELSSAYYFNDDTTTYFAGTDGSAAAGLDADALRFTSRSRAIPENLSASEHNALAYDVEDGKLMHDEMLNPLSSAAANRQRFPMTEEIAGFRLRYLDDTTKEWQDGWTTEEHDGKLPRAVEITLYFNRLGVEQDAREKTWSLTSLVELPMGRG